MEIQAKEPAEENGGGKGLIGKKIRKKDGKRQVPGDVEDFDPETKLYKVRFVAGHIEEMTWEELKNCLPQEISFKRFSQKKKKEVSAEETPSGNGPEVSDDENTAKSSSPPREEVDSKSKQAEVPKEDIIVTEAADEADHADGEKAAEAADEVATEQNLEIKKADVQKVEESSIVVIKEEKAGEQETVVIEKLSIEQTTSDEQKKVEETEVSVAAAEEQKVEEVVMIDKLSKADEQNAEDEVQKVVESSPAAAAAAAKNGLATGTGKIQEAVSQRQLMVIETTTTQIKEKENGELSIPIFTVKKKEKKAVAVSEPEDQAEEPGTDEDDQSEADEEEEEEEEEEDEDENEEEDDQEEAEDEEESEEEVIRDAPRLCFGGEDSDSSLNESDLEMLTRKKIKKKRKHVLTLQRWRGYKKKRKLAAESKKLALLAENPDAAVVFDAMEEVAPRKKSRTRKLAEVDEIQRKRQKIASELKKKLKARSGGSAAAAAATPKKSKDVPEAEEQALDVTPVAEIPTNSSRLNEELKSPNSSRVDELKSPYPDSKPSPFDRGIKLRGRKLRKIFKGKVTRGEVADYCRRTRYYKIRYEDGEEEKLMWKFVEPMLVPFEQLHTWNDPESDSAHVSVYKAEIAAAAARAEKKAKPKTPKLKPQVVKRR